MSEPLDWIEQATKAGVELKESIKEAHELCRDLRQLRKELMELKASVLHEVEHAANETFQKAFLTHIKNYTDKLEKHAMELITQLADELSAQSVEAIKDLSIKAKEFQRVKESGSYGLEP